MKERIITAIIAAPIFLIFLIFNHNLFWVMISILSLIGIYEMYKMNKNKKGKKLLTSITILYIVLGFIAMGYVRMEEGLLITIWLMVTIWATDSFAYFIGKAIGKTKLAPSISPNKTIEGSLGGTICAIMFSLILNLVFDINDNIIELIIITLVISILGQIGDLIESKIKRIFEVKDSGNILPGHGGIFDRFDSMIIIFIAYGLYIFLI